jgi:hypothetical protein
LLKQWLIINHFADKDINKSKDRGFLLGEVLSFSGNFKELLLVGAIKSLRNNR